MKNVSTFLKGVSVDMKYSFYHRVSEVDVYSSVLFQLCIQNFGITHEWHNLMVHKRNRSDNEMKMLQKTFCVIIFSQNVK